MALKETNPHLDEKMTKAIFVLTFFGALGGFLFGYDTGVVSGVMLLIRKEFSLSTLWQELIVSITTIGAWFAALVAGPTADYFGRKNVLLFSSLVFVVGSLVLALAPNPESLLIGRAIVGFGIGISSVCIPMYISEMAPPSSRGQLSIIYTIMITGGQLVAAVVCGLFSEQSNGWRWILGLGGVPGFIQMVALFFVPESPRWLSLHERLDDAKHVLEKYRHPNTDVNDEVAAISKDSSHQQASLSTILHSKSACRALILGCLLQMYQQLAGINTVMYYSASIIAMAGISSDQMAIWLAAVTAFFNFAFTFVGLFLVERLGRRPLVLISLAGVTLALFSIGISFNISELKSPKVTIQSMTSPCSEYTFCSSCVADASCGFCFIGKTSDLHNTSCLFTNNSASYEMSRDGTCSDPDAHFAYNWCPSQYAWLSVLGLCLYLCFFAPGMGPMPWTINSEIYPNWARARCSSIATSFNWAANIFVSLTFLSLTEAITPQGTLYLYGVLAFTGLLIFFFILPETKGVKLEDMESLFQTPLCSQRPWKKKEKDNWLIHSVNLTSSRTLMQL